MNPTYSFSRYHLRYYRKKLNSLLPSLWLLQIKPGSLCFSFSFSHVPPPVLSQGHHNMTLVPSSRDYISALDN